MTLARALECKLVVFCSRDTRAVEVNELLALRKFTQGVIVDLPGDYTLKQLDFATSKLTYLDYSSGYVNPNGDLSIKRNLGLLLARMLGWERIFFMDDDIRDLDSSALRGAVSMLGPYRTVGMRAIDYPDNSVVCHGHRETGAYQDVFISGSVLAVHCAGPVTFFPEIYNEDWFFFYHDAAARRLGWPGQDVTQLWYDPFANPKRAAVQEFGDVMAEGLYGLLHYGIGAERATADYWKIFLGSRLRFLEAVLARSEKVELYLRRRIATSIMTAMTWSRKIEPSTCEHYIKLWQQDLDIWEQRLKDVPRRLSVKAALHELDLTPPDLNPFVLAGIIRKSRNGASKAAMVGAAALISSSLSLDDANAIEALGPSEDAAVGADSGRHLSFAQVATSAWQKITRVGRGFLDETALFSEALLRLTMSKLAKEPPKPRTATRQSGRLRGRHRKPSEPAADDVSSDIRDPGAAQGDGLAGASSTSGSSRRR